MTDIGHIKTQLRKKGIATNRIESLTQQTFFKTMTFKERCEYLNRYHHCWADFAVASAKLLKKHFNIDKQRDVIHLGDHIKAQMTNADDSWMTNAVIEITDINSAERCIKDMGWIVGNKGQSMRLSVPIAEVRDWAFINETPNYFLHRVDGGTEGRFENHQLQHLYLAQ